MGWPGLIAAMMVQGNGAWLEPVGLKEVFPGVRIDAAQTMVEFDARVSPALVRDPRAPKFYLEVLVCSPDTREHETFLVTTVRPSDVHAAMLVIGLIPGSPGGWTQREGALAPVPPTGDRIDVRFVYANDAAADAGAGDAAGGRVVADPLDWIIRAEDGVRFKDFERERSDRPGWVFAGSRIIRRPEPAGGRLETAQPRDGNAPARIGGAEMYDADGTGIVVGLTTFGSEVIGWSRVISPEAAVEPPTWIADFDRTPRPGTDVVVRLRKRRTASGEAGPRGGRGAE